MLPFDLALGLWMIGRATAVLHILVLQPFRQLPRDVAGAVITQQARFVDDMNLVTSRRRQSQVQCVRHVLGSHVGAKLPRDDVAAVVVEDRAEIEPPPAQNFEISEVCLP